MEKLEKLCSGQLINTEIQQGTLTYLKENNIIYNSNIPEFALQDNEYVLMCLELEPTAMKEITGKNQYFYLDSYPEVAKKIAEKIQKEQIKFQDIPIEYQECRDIYEKIININPDALQQRNNCLGLNTITRYMTEQEAVDYYRNMGIPINANTIDYNNFTMVLEGLKDDYLLLAHTEKEFTIEQYEAIYETLKGSLEPEQVLSSKFLTQNPYFINSLIEQGIDLTTIDLQETRYYNELYEILQETAEKNGTEIPKPIDYYEKIEIGEDGTPRIYIESMTDIKRGLKYIEEKSISRDLEIILEYSKTIYHNNNECIITDNIEYFEQLLKNGVNVNFRYDLGEKIFPLEEIIRMEHFMQGVVDDIKKQNYSPLEQLIAVYDIAKTFKPYNGSKTLSGSRGLYEILDNEYIVCAGYANLIENLAHRLNAPYIEISVQTQNEPHARNYVNIVDEKYNINGFYALDATWEQENLMSESRIEALRSSYENFLLTTEEGRKEPVVMDRWSFDYDTLLTLKTPEEIREYFAQYNTRDEWLYNISVLDPEFYKTMVALDFSKDENSQVLIDYFNTKVNNPVSKEKLLDAIMQVKKNIYVNFTEQDFEDMRMQYSIRDPFCDDYEKCMPIYNQYMDRRYEEIKSSSLSLINAQKSNPCLDVELFLLRKIEEMLKNNIPNEMDCHKSFIYLFDENIIEIAGQNSIEIENNGFKYYEHEYRDGTKDFFLKYVVRPDRTIEENIALCENAWSRVRTILGIQPEISTEDLGRQTLEEQNNTEGKAGVLEEINRQIQEQQRGENTNNHESK